MTAQLLASKCSQTDESVADVDRCVCRSRILRLQSFELNLTKFLCESTQWKMFQIQVESLGSNPTWGTYIILVIALYIPQTVIHIVLYAPLSVYC